MSYTINPNAKNKWARNAENTMDLSLETDASSVYLDNGRTLEQEIGEGSMVSNMATVDNAMSKVIDGTLDGAYESLVFKGKSLVNVIGKITVSNNAIDNRDGSYTINKNTAYSRINIFGGNPMIKVNTPYYFTVIVSNGTLTNLNVDVGTSVTRQQLGNGKYLITLTEKSFNIEANRLFWYQSLSTTSKETVTIYPILVEYQQGMENWDIPYFTGICDSKMPILRNLSSEAFCHDSLEAGTINGNEGVDATASNARARTKGKKRLNGATSVLFSDNLLGVEKYLFSYDSNGKYLGRTPDNWETGNEIKPIDGAYYYRVVFAKYSEELPHSMHIIPKHHKTNILRTSEEIVLREVGGVQDTYNLLTGEYVRRIGEIILNGSETNWIISGNTVNLSGQTTISFQRPFNGIRYGGNTADSLIINSDKLYGMKLATSTSDLQYDTEYIRPYSSTSENVGIRLLKSKLQTQDVDGLKQYLSQNPITVQYELAEPIVSTIEPLTIPFAYQNGHIILESGYEGQSLLPTLEYSTVVNKTGQIENVAKTIQRQEKQLTMLEKMLIQNIINLDYNNTLLTLKNEMEEML